MHFNENYTPSFSLSRFLLRPIRLFCYLVKMTNRDESSHNTLKQSVPQWIEICCDVPAEMADEVADFLVTVTGSGVTIDNFEVDTFSINDVAEPENKSIKAYVSSDTDLQDLCHKIDAYLAEEGKNLPNYHHRPCQTAPLPDEDWSSRWKENFKPTRVSEHIIIKPSWEPYSAAPTDVVVEIDPGMAFGTGTHPTTRLCLQCVEKIAHRLPPYASAILQIVLDVGTGSGILAIAAAKMKALQVIAIDIDPEAVAAADINFRMNGVESIISASTTPLASVSGEFDVVIANILAEDLARMATELIKRVKMGGYLVLSGILIEREPVVTSAFSPHLQLAEISHDGEWSLISYRRIG